MPSHRFQLNFTSLKGISQNSKRQTGSCFGYFRGEIDLPWFFLVFTMEIASNQKRQINDRVFRHLLGVEDTLYVTIEFYHNRK